MSGDLALACAAALIDALASGGVTDVVMSPGARSTPLVLAASRNTSLRVHVILDERSAAFYGLGLAKASLRPVVLLCTSGTAPVNYHPAIVEARYSATPLIALTADRPPSLRGTGANQTIDQVNLYGSAPVWFCELPLPGDNPAVFEDAGMRAVAFALGRPGGPVHLNVPFSEPLSPSKPPETRSTPIPHVDRVSWIPSDLSALAATLNAEPRGVIVACGMSRRAPLEELAGALGWPLIAEPQSQLRNGHAGLLAPQQMISHMDPGLVLHVGDPPTSRATRSLIDRAPVVVSITPHGYADPEHRSYRSVHAGPNDTVSALKDHVHGAGWAGEWTDADKRVRAAIDTELDAMEDAFDGAVARDVAALMTPGSVLLVGNSMPIRAMDTFMLSTAARIIVNRGASGIDGFISTAFGVVRNCGSATALMGDLTFLHDAGSLPWLAAHGTTPVTLVVVDNGGGGVFDYLPQASQPEHEALFVTPHRAGIEAIATAAGCAYTRVAKMRDLAPALKHQSGVHVVHVICDRERDAACRRVVAEAADAARREA